MLELVLIPAQTLGYRSFVEAFPDGTVLTRETGVSRRYGENPYVGYDDASTDPIGGFISQPIDDQFGPKDRVVGVIDGAQTFGILLERLTEVGVVAIACRGPFAGRVPRTGVAVVAGSRIGSRWARCGADRRVCRNGTGGYCVDVRGRG